MTINTELLERVFDLIRKDPAHWDQSGWIIGTQGEVDLSMIDKGQPELCGTTCCIAGWAMLLSGEFRPVFNDTNTFINDMIEVSSGSTTNEIAESEDSSYNDPDEVYLWEGARLLGLTEAQATHLFLRMEPIFDPETEEYDVEDFIYRVKVSLNLPVEARA